MKKTVFLIPTLIFSLYLTGCARNNANDNVATRNNPNVNQPTRVNYPNNGDVGPNIMTNDTNINRNRNRNNINNVNDNNRITNVNDNANDNRSKMRVADKAADKVADLPEVDTANVIVTENNAYVAAKLNNGSNNGLSNDVENKISKTVKSVDRDIDNVYVSVNPDFYDQMNDYARDIRNGRPVSGFFNEFTDAVRRVFPDLK